MKTLVRVTGTLGKTVQDNDGIKSLARLPDLAPLVLYLRHMRPFLLSLPMLLAAFVNARAQHAVSEIAQGALPRPGQWFASPEAAPSNDVRFCRAVHFFQNDDTIVACPIGQGGTLSRVSASDEVTWRVPWPINYVTENVIERADRSLVISRLAPNCPPNATSGNANPTTHCTGPEVAEVLVLGTRGETLRVHRFATSHWSQIESLDMHTDGSIAVGGVFRDDISIEVAGRLKRMRSGYFSGFAAKLSADLTTVEWMTQIGGRDTHVNAVRWNADGSLGLVGVGRESVVAGRHRARIEGTDRFYAHLDSRGRPNRAHAIAAAPASQNTGAVFFVSVSGGIAVLNAETGGRIVHVPLAARRTSAILRTRDPKRVWILAQVENRIETSAYVATEVAATGATGRSSTVYASNPTEPVTHPNALAFFGTAGSFALDAHERLWVSGNLTGRTWSSLPFAFVWWSEVPLHASPWISRTPATGTALLNACGTPRETRHSEVFHRFAARRYEEWRQACNLDPGSHGLTATTTFNDDGTVATISVTEALPEPQRSCVANVLRTRRICPGPHRGSVHLMSVDMN